jgi:hypothetical protein
LDLGELKAFTTIKSKKIKHHSNSKFIKIFAILEAAKSAPYHNHEGK